MTTPPPERRPSALMAWLGLGLAVASLLTIWVVNICMFFTADPVGVVTPKVYASTFVVAAVLGLAGLTASVIGLAVKCYAAKRWAAVAGIVVCGLSLASVPATYVMLQRIMVPQTLDIHLPDAQPVPVKAPDVVIALDSVGTIHCYDNRRGIDTAPRAIVLTDERAGEQLSAWLTTKGITQNDAIDIRCYHDTPYTSVDSIFTILNRLDIKRFTLSSAVHEEE